MLKLDKKDQKILRSLDKDARSSVSEIAKAVGLSKEVVSYRINRLEQRGVISGYCAIIDTPRLGYLFYRILLKTKFSNPNDENEFIDYLSKRGSISWVGTLDGEWDLVILVWAKDPIEFKEIFDEICNQYSECIENTFVTIATKIYHYLHNYLYDRPDNFELILGNKYDNLTLDESDQEILKIITKNCRMPLLEMASKVGLSINTIKYRLKKMKDNGILLGYRAIIDASLLGYEHFKVLLSLRGTSKQEKISIITYLKGQKNLIYITEAIGLADLEFEVMLNGTRDLHEFINLLRLEFPNLISNVSSLLTYKEHYINYFPL